MVQTIELADEFCKTTREREVLEGVVGKIVEVLNPEKVIIFGSRVTDNFSSHADFDLAISGSEPNFKTREKLRTELKDVRGLYGIDHVFLDDIEEDFKNVILSEGKTVYERKSTECN